MSSILQYNIYSSLNADDLLNELCKPYCFISLLIMTKRTMKTNNQFLSAIYEMDDDILFSRQQTILSCSGV